MKDFLRQNGILLVVVAVLLSVALWLGSALLGGTDPVTNLTNTVTTPVRGGITAVSAQARTLSSARSSQELMEGIRALKKAREYAQGNISPAAVCGWLAWELR